MSHKGKIKDVARAVACAWLALSAGWATAAEPRPNFLIIMADDLGYGDLGIHGGYVPTPNLDKLFQSGMVLGNFMVNPLCSPTRAGLLTGCNSLRLNQGPYVDGVLSTSVKTFGSAFQQAGYKTGIFGKWHNSVAPVFDSSMPDVNDYGFDEWVGGYGGGFDFFTKIWPNQNSTPCWYHNRTHVTNDMDYITDTLTDNALRFMNENTNNSFFCYLPYTAMHTPYHVKEADLAKVPQAIIDEAGGLRPWQEYYALINKTTFNGLLYTGYVQLTGDHSMDSITGTLSDADKKILYAAMLISLDENVGRLLDYLETSGLETNTVVWFFSDNGGVPSSFVRNQPLRGNKATIWEGGIHSRAVVRWPAMGWGVPKTFDGLMGNLDVYPTCMAMAGLPVPGAGEIDGKSCFDAMQNNTLSPVDAYYYLWEGADMIRSPQWKLFRYWNRTELYNMQTDLGEATNVAAQYPEQVQALTAKLDAWMATNSIAGGHLPQVATQQTAGLVHRAPMEVEFIQTAACNPPNQVMVRILTFSPFRIETGDQLEYDIRFDGTSKIDGGHLTLQRSTGRNFFLNQSVDQSADMFSTTYSYEDARSQWAHRVVGMGHGCPEKASSLGFWVTGSTTGSYHFAVDNVVVRRRDGSTKVLWQSGMPVGGASVPQRVSGLKVYTHHPGLMVSLIGSYPQTTNAVFTPVAVNGTEWKGAPDDLFRNAIVSGSTSVISTNDNILDLFSGPDFLSKGFVVFTDVGSTLGTVNHVDFNLPASVDLSRVTVTLSYDQPTKKRAINRVKVYASDVAGSIPFSRRADVAVEPDYFAAYGSAGLAVSIDVPADNVRYFRIEVVAESNGPRVVEIDGFGQVVSE